MTERTHNHKVGASKEEQLRELIGNLSAYIEQYHGGWVEMVALEGEVLRVRLGGACDECDLSAATLKGWIGGTVRQFFPEVREVVSV